MGHSGHSGPVLALCLLAAPAWGDYDPSQYPAYETCALCHGLFGVSHTAKFPNLGGQKPDYIRRQIQAFQTGNRTNDGGQMVDIVSELKPEDIEVVIDWFSGQDPPHPYPAADVPADAPALFADLGCAGCHDNRPDGDPTIPYLTAQHAGYLAKQMTDFRDGARDAAALVGLHRDMLTVSDDQIAGIAAYLAAEPRR
ncbi:MAG: c-type cytochrome [Marinibacterium sp.]